MTEQPVFGTSGLRGRAEGFTRQAVFAHIGGFLETACTNAESRAVLVGRDLRGSSPHIAGLVCGAISALGWRALNAGTLPTPALALYALDNGLPAIMVTGSHIPAEFNGLKFYRPDGELLKSDEAPIRAAAQRLSDAPQFDPVLPEFDPAAEAGYVKRFAAAIASDALEGLSIGVYQHSAVGRDLIPRVLESFGAHCTALGRSDVFVALDTEAVDAGTMVQLRAALAGHGFDAVISSDGDGDRPLLIDAGGRQVNGDVMGALTARWLGATRVVTPLTSTSALEASNWFEKVTRTQIGSPYVVEAMAKAGGAVVGFEANGGFLTGSDLELSAGVLTRLPTRDALLPLIAALAQARARNVPVADLVSELPGRVMKADRLRNVAPQTGARLVAGLASSPERRADIDPMLARPVAIDTMDGTRLTMADGTIVHFRQSGNAPELRCYVESRSLELSEAVLTAMMTGLAAYLQRQDQS